MSTVTISKKAEGIQGFTTGSFTGDGTATTLSLGYNPSEIDVINETDATLWRKFDPMVAANAIKVVTAGTLTVDTSSAILFNGDGTVTLSSGLCITGKAIKFIARR